MTHHRHVLAKSIFVLGLLLASALGSLPQSSPCKQNADCHPDFGKSYVCSPKTSTCIRDKYSWSLFEIVGFFSIFFIMLLNTSGGSGATTMLVPTMIFFFDFHSTDAVHLARFTIFMGGLTNFILNWNRLDPKTGKFLVICYQTTAVMVPLHIAGAEIGSILNKLLPPIVILGFLFIILVRSLHDTVYRAIKETEKESEMAEAINLVKRITFQFPNLLGESLLDPSESTIIEENKDAEKSAEENSKAKLPEDQGSVTTAVTTMAQEATAPSGESAKAVDSPKSAAEDGFALIRQSFSLQNIEELILHRQREILADMNFDADIESVGSYKIDEKKMFDQMTYDPDWKPNQIKFNPFRINSLVKRQKWNICISLMAFLVSVLSALMRGGSGIPSIIGLPQCSPYAWVVVGASQCLCMLVACLGYFNNKNISKKEIDATESMAIYKDSKIRNKLILAAYLTGIGAGTAGVGGSMLLNIYTLKLGLSLSATGNFSMMSTMCSSSSTSIQSLMTGGSHLEHAYLVIIFALAGSLFANFCLRRILHALGTYSIRVWTLVLVLSLSSLVLPFQMITAIVNHSKLTFEFGSLC